MRRGVQEVVDERVLNVKVFAETRETDSAPEYKLCLSGVTDSLSTVNTTDSTYIATPKLPNQIVDDINPE